MGLAFPPGSRPISGLRTKAFDDGFDGVGLRGLQ
jgi:hypothetical protein